MEYKCVINNTNTGLQENINELISKDWKPIGGISVTIVTNGVGQVGVNEKFIYAQAMIKE